MRDCKVSLGSGPPRPLAAGAHMSTVVALAAEGGLRRRSQWSSVRGSSLEWPGCGDDD